MGIKIVLKKKKIKFDFDYLRFYFQVFRWFFICFQLKLR